MLYKKKNDHLHSSFEDFHDNVVIFLKSQKSFKAQSQRESYSSFFTIMQSKTRFQFSFHLWHVEERWKCTEFLDRNIVIFRKMRQVNAGIVNQMHFLWSNYFVWLFIYWMLYWICFLLQIFAKKFNGSENHIHALK